MAAIDQQTIDTLMPVTGQADGASDQPPVGAAIQSLSGFLPAANQAQPTVSTNQTQTQTPEDLSKAPIFQVRATHYGYEKPGDEGYDPNSAGGKGAWDNQLTGGVSVALSPDMEQRLGAKPNDALTFTGSDGTQRNLVFHDRTNQSLRGRIDVYDPTGQIGDLGQGTISKTGAQGPTIPALETSETQVQKLPGSFGMRVATNDDVQKFDSYIQSGGDINQIPTYDKLAVAIAKDPDYLLKPQNFDTYNLS